MKPSNEEKARFFASYWGQICLDEHGDPSIWNGLFDISEYKMELKPLSSISDEDAIEVSRIVHTQYGKVVDRIQRTVNKICIHTVDKINPHEKYLILLWFKSANVFVYAKEGDNQRMIANWNQSSISDCLRKRKYAIPFHGHTVEQMTSFGWVKLKKQ